MNREPKPDYLCVCCFATTEVLRDDDLPLRQAVSLAVAIGIAHAIVCADRAEPLPMCPEHAGDIWEIVQRLGNHLPLAPEAMRRLAQLARQFP